MALYEYGVGGNEVKIDANEAIAEIPSNRTLLVQKLTEEAPLQPETTYGLETLEDVFERFHPSVELEFQDQEGNEIPEKLDFKGLSDFSAKKLKENSPFLSQLNIEREQYLKISRLLSSNKALLKSLSDEEARAEMIQVLEASLLELEDASRTKE
ncbi:MAG: hypothetical protein HXO48_06895 [Prevotella sp.]|jgi:hypothetical protein|uniref:Uncharacterized protein n=1 Tax=Mogibacterium diversum TaxID=114527 RepID=A0A930HAW0_9FIRM|nr:hypothetical protein [Mogibacterium diversum]MBF1630639.1 hypothetical protein [Prevotella sp.]